MKAKKQYRIVETKQGYAVEINIKKWSLFGLKDNWIPFIVYRGTQKPYLYDSLDSAKKGLINELKELINAI